MKTNILKTILLSTFVLSLCSKQGLSTNKYKEDLSEEKSAQESSYNKQESSYNEEDIVDTNLNLEPGIAYDEQEISAIVNMFNLLRSSKKEKDAQLDKERKKSSHLEQKSSDLEQKVNSYQQILKEDLIEWLGTLKNVKIDDEDSKHLNPSKDVLKVSKLDLRSNNLTTLPRILIILSNLTVLDLRGNNIGYEGAQSVSGMSNLTELNLSHNKIGADGAKSLSVLSNLKGLDLWNNNISDAAQQKLRTDLPNCRISFTVDW